MPRSTTRSAFALLGGLGLVGCAPKPQAVLVRFADDVPHADMLARCGPSPDRRSLDRTVEWGQCMNHAGDSLSNALERFVGRRLLCDYREETGFGPASARGFGATPRFLPEGDPGSLVPKVYIVYDRPLPGQSYGLFMGPWAYKESWTDRVRYRETGSGNATLGGYCERSQVFALSKTLDVLGRELVLGETWRCSRVLPKGHFNELRCRLE